MGDGSQALYHVFTPGDEVYDAFGIEMIGAISGESLIIHFTDDVHMQEWRSSSRSVTFTSIDNEAHLWEGFFNLNRDEEEQTESDQYEYAYIDLATAPSTDDYEDAVQSMLADTATVNNYDPAVTADFIEYSMISMGVGGTNAQALAAIVDTAGESHSLDMTLK